MSSPPGSPAQESRKAEEQSVTWKHEIQQLSQVRERCWIAQGRELVHLDFQMGKTPGLDWKMRRIGLFPRATWLAGLQDLRAAERQHQHQEERVQKVHAELVTERSCTEEQVKGRVW